MPNFSKIWATNSPLPAYTFSDSEYLTGWDFVAAAPPTKTQFDAWFKLTDEKLQYLYEQLQNTASKLYPVGSVYISFSATDPSTLFGGVWQRLKDTFLLANGDTYAANTTGGSATKTLTVNNMPEHNHTVNSAGAHTHTATTASAGAHTHTATTSSNGAHTHTRGSMNITGAFPGTCDNTRADNTSVFSGAFTRAASAGNKTGNDADKVAASVINFSASRSWSGSTSSNGAHTHTLTTSSNGAHTHTVTVNSNGAHTHTTNNTGGNAPINIMPPYTTVYMWRRTA